MFKVNNGNTRTRCEICSKLKIKTPKRRQSNIQKRFLGRILKNVRELLHIPLIYFTLLYLSLIFTTILKLIFTVFSTDF